jgi:hypothetical protein
MEYHLRLTIHRDRTVEREHSFHFGRLRGGNCGHRTEYAAEILDADGRTLICVPLGCSCNLCRPNCYPIIIRDRIPMPDGASLLRVWEGREKKIYEEVIPDPPHVQLKSKTRTSEGLALKWEAKSDSSAKTAYILQYEDRPGIWRELLRVHRRQSW